MFKLGMFDSATAAVSQPNSRITYRQLCLQQNTIFQGRDATLRSVLWLLVIVAPLAQYAQVYCVCSAPTSSSSTRMKQWSNDGSEDKSKEVALDSGLNVKRRMKPGIWLNKQLPVKPHTARPL